MKNNFTESDLYLPIKTFFEQQGFSIKSEVKNCDIVGIKNDMLVVIELKKIFSLQIIYQAIDRLKITNNVYIAIPRPKNLKKTKNMLKLLKTLNLGLIYVSMDSPIKLVSIVITPQAIQKKSMATKKILKEFNERTFDINTGGINKTKIITAYTEKALKIACSLHDNGPCTAAFLIKTFNCDKHTHSILYKNHYNWFEKIDHGIYNISIDGKKALEDKRYKQLVDVFINQLEEKNA